MCTNTKLYKALPHLVSVTVINSLMSATDPPSLSRRGRGRGGGGAGQTHGVHIAALDDRARTQQPDGDAVRLYVLGGVLLLAAHLRRSRNAHIMPPQVYLPSHPRIAFLYEKNRKV